ncbi:MULTISPECIES: SIR2 family protein [Flavobacterium]|uniref:SIR2 family protein n=1 Tax=Flavobacterium jumunjinense TaxID=998845 RepID=A0ABV5GTS4_9FLAO|nr:MULTISPECIES: SIR2 family protein [Flavobacterium]
MTEKPIIPPELEKAIINNNLVIFIGAGCSMSLGFPSWKQLIEDIVENLNSKYGESSDVNFKNILNALRNNTKSLFEVIDKIENDLDHGMIYKKKSLEFIINKLDGISSKLPLTSEIHSKIWNVSDKIITTNYDKVLEKYLPENINPTIFDNTNVFQTLKSQKNNASFLYKIHGDYQNPDSIIFFKSDYNKIYDNQNSNNDALINHFKEKTLLFIGFSLSDPFINDLFNDIKKIYNGYTINEHYVFSTRNESFIKYDINTIKIDNWNKSLLSYLTAFEKIKADSSKIKSDLIIEKIDKTLTKDDVGNLADLIDQKTKELINSPNDKLLNKEIRDLRVKINHLLFGRIDYLQKVDKPYRQNDLQTIFDTIYSSEKLDTQTIEDIQKIRSNTDIYKWYDRSVIISAISCSLIHFNKPDEKKITLLIDFINDNEEKVWQKAIVSLFLVLNHLGYKWLRFDSIKNKIKSLNQNLRIQDACSKIIKLFSIGLNNVSVINEEIFVNEYFNDNPYNYFLPFHQDENPAFDAVYDNYEGSDIEDYISFLEEVPLPDQIKYFFCGIDKKKKKKKNSEKEENAKMILNHFLKYNSAFYPYSVYVQELIGFYKFFPKHIHEAKLKSQLILTETPLKDYLLNEKEKFSALGNHFMRNENWAQAIVNYKKSVEYGESDLQDLLNLANCYNNNKEYNKEYEIRNKIINKEPKNENNLIGFFDFYLKQKKNFKKALEISETLLSIDKNNAKYYNLKGISCGSLKNNEKAILSFNKAIDLDSNVSGYYKNRAKCFMNLKENEKSIIDWNKAIELDPEEIDNYYSRSHCYYWQEEYLNAIDDLNYVISKEKNDSLNYLERALSFLALSRFEEALKDIEKAKMLNNEKDTIYHAYSNYFRLMKQYDEAFKYIEMALNIKKESAYIGTKATIYATKGDDENFYLYLEEALIAGADSDTIYIDIKNKYKEESRFVKLLEQYNKI